MELVVVDVAKNSVDWEKAFSDHRSGPGNKPENRHADVFPAQDRLR